MSIDFKKDKSWFAIIILLFTVTPIGFIALFGKIAYMFYQSSKTVDDLSEVKSYKVKPVQTLDDLSELVENDETMTMTFDDDFEVENSEMTIEIDPVEIDPIEIDPIDLKPIVAPVESLQNKEPLKIITCPMCGTENKIYKIDVFETPACEKCGMLLLDR